ncbi:DUF192 domain-containing protein [Candidatus Poriferisodalis sp.]|uniref:DUF192 domain-containing protein n=1 Tax=Candidatus Poriferisodalis sp. TaxID=3101277 RepID=UPI003B029F51
MAASSAVADTVQVRSAADADTATTVLAPAISGGANVGVNADTTIARNPAETGPAAVPASADVSAPEVDESPDAWALQVLDAAEPPAGFDEGLLRVESSSQTTVWPVIVAATPQSRSAGLMSVEDFDALGGYAAMVFVFDGDTTGAFWMRDTPLPLRITFVTADGEVVSGTDMVPCLPPTPARDCARYYADGPYRIAIEHPLGPSFDLGLGSATGVTLAR